MSQLSPRIQQLLDDLSDYLTGTEKQAAAANQCLVHLNLDWDDDEENLQNLAENLESAVAAINSAQKDLVDFLDNLQNG